MGTAAKSRALLIGRHSTVRSMLSQWQATMYDGANDNRYYLELDLNTVKWISLQGLLAGCFYLGMIKGLEAARVATLVIAWASILRVFFLLTDESLELMKHKSRSVHAAVGGVIDAVAVIAFSIYGYWITAIFYLVRSCALFLMWDVIDKYTAEAAALAAMKNDKNRSPE